MEHARMRRNSWLGIVLLCLCTGCQHDMYPDDDVDQAKLIPKRRVEAARQLRQFVRSEGQDFEALTKYSELHRETTKIDPDSCPLCFAHYGASLSRIGIYYETLIDVLKKEKLRLPPREQAPVQERIDNYSDLAKEAYRNSNRQFEVYFRSENVDPSTYEWVLRQSVALGDFDSALYYLDQFVANARLSAEGEENARALRLRLDRGQARQRDTQLQDELRNDQFFKGLEDANAN